MNSIKLRLNDIIAKYHAQDIQATPEEFILMLEDGMTPTERRLFEEPLRLPARCEDPSGEADDEAQTQA